MSNMDAFASNEVQVKRFADLSEQEILALAITNEEEDSRIYRGFAEGLREKFSASAKVFDEMAEEEVRHRTMLFDLAEIEDQHENLAHKLGQQILTKAARATENETSRRMFVLQYVQPGLAGLMDGSVSTLAPLFAAAFATHNTWQTFLVGLAASVGAGISMGFAEALSDDGSLTGRGAPLVRGTICGVMTTIGGLGHTLPYLISNFWTATSVAIAVVDVELAVISYTRHHFMDTPLLSAAFQVVVGGVLVFLAGIAIGSS